MKTPTHVRKLTALLFVLSTIHSQLSTCSAQSTAFTYQGRLNNGAALASGTYDFQFALFDVASGGLPLEEVPVLTNAAVVVSEGLFTTTLDFGNEFSGSDRWLEISVRTNGSGAFATLAPRQKFTPTPYAMYAPNAGYAGTSEASGLLGTLPSSIIAPGTITSAMLAPGAISGLGSPDGSPANALNVNTNGYVGLGTTNPTAALSLTGGPTQIVPRVLAQIQDGFGSFTNLNGVSSVAVKGNLLAVGANGDDAVTLINIANPNSLVWTNSLRDGNGVFTNLNGVVSVAFSSTSNLLAIAAQNDSTVTLVDVNNPGSPVKRAELRDGVGSFLELSGARSVAFASNLLAIAAFNDNAVTLVDVSNPATPVFRIAMKDGQFGFNELGGVSHVALSGNLLAIAAAGDSAVTLVDVSNPTSPILRAVLKDGVGSYDDLANPFAVALSGNLLAICAYIDDAVTLVDVSNPATPIKRAVLKDGIGGFNYLNGVFSVAFSSNLLVICSDSDDAVTLVDVSNPASPQLRGVARNGVGDAHLLDAVTSVAFAGTNLVVGANNSSAFTILSPELQTMGLSSAGWVGIGVAAPQAALHVQGDVLMEGDSFTVQTTRVQIGNNVTASGGYSTAMGSSTTASGYSSTAMGSSTTASGDYSTAMGYGTTASGDYSTAMGSSTTASGVYAMALGYDSSATHRSSFVWSDSLTFPGMSSVNSNTFNVRASGGVHFQGGADASLAGGGQLILGATTGANMVLDSNEIITRNNGATATLAINNNGGDVTIGAAGTSRLGIGRSPAANELEVNGNASKTVSGSWLANSDARIKQEVQTVSGALDTLGKVRLVSFRYSDDYRAEHQSIADRRYLNVIAQEFAEVFPEHVKPSGEKMPDGSDILQVDIHPLTIYSAAAIQELQHKLEQKQDEIAELKNRNQSMERRLERLEHLLAKPAH